MSTQRFLFILFLLLNLLAYAAIQGWLGEAPVGETDRLARQINPDQIKLLGPPPKPPARSSVDAVNDASPASDDPRPDLPDAPPGPPPTPAADPEQCVIWTNLAANDGTRLQAALNAAEIEHSASERETVSSWWVRIPPQPNRDAAERQARELRAQKINDFFIVRDPGPNLWSISLGNFKTEAAARRYRDQLNTQGIKAASVTPRTTTERLIEATAPAARIEAAIAGLSFARNHAPCPPAR